MQAASGHRRQNVGKKPKVPAGEAERLLRLHAVSEKWLRYTAAVKDDLPARPRQSIDQAAESIRAVQHAADARG